MNVWIFTKENEKAPHAVLFEQQLSVEGWHHYVIYWPRQPPHRPRVRPGPGVQISGGRHWDSAARRNWDVRNINNTLAKIMQASILLGRPDQKNWVLGTVGWESWIRQIWMLKIMIYLFFMFIALRHRKTLQTCVKTICESLKRPVTDLLQSAVA